MLEDALDDVRSNALFLIGFVNDNVPYRSAIYIVREHSSESDQLIAVPRTERKIRVPEHFFGILDRPVLGPGRLMEQAQELLRLKLFFFRESNGGLEGRRHLVLEYLLACEAEERP